MKLWLIFLQEMEHEKHTWLEAAWDDETTAENEQGWREEVERCRKIAYEGKYEMRIVAAVVPGIYEAFDIAEIKAKVVS